MTVLLKSQKIPTATDNDGRTALFYALNPTQRHSKCLEMVCKAGADVNAVVSWNILFIEV